jgi:hypothetical protein
MGDIPGTQWPNPHRPDLATPFPRGSKVTWRHGAMGAVDGRTTRGSQPLSERETRLRLYGGAGSQSFFFLVLFSLFCSCYVFLCVVILGVLLCGVLVVLVVLLALALALALACYILISSFVLGRNTLFVGLVPELFIPTCRTKNGRCKSKCTQTV